MKKIKLYLIDYLENYKKKYFKKHVIITTILFFLFISMVTVLLFNKENSLVIQQLMVQSTNKGIKLLMGDKLLFNALVLFSGITPYLFIPVFGALLPNQLAFSLATSILNNASLVNIIFRSLGAIIQIIAIALSIAVGLEFTTISTKRFKYSQFRGFSFLDLKKELYEIKKDEVKVKKIVESQNKKNEKMEKNNVKVPYKNLIITFIISSVIIIIGTLIARI